MTYTEPKATQTYAHLSGRLNLCHLEGALETLTLDEQRSVLNFMVGAVAGYITPESWNRILDLAVTEAQLGPWMTR